MNGGKASYALGAMMFLVGVVAVNTVFEPLAPNQSYHPALVLSLISLGVFVLCALYYGNYSYMLMIICGMYFGSSIATRPFYSLLAALPLLYAMSAGSEMGDAAHRDFIGKTNFFDGRNKYIASAALVFALAAIIGMIFGYMDFSNLPSFAGIDFEKLLSGARIQ